MESNEKGSKDKAFNLSSFFRKLYQDPYGTLDQLDLKAFGFQFNLFKDDQKLLVAMIGPFLIAPIVAWILTAIIMLLTTPYNGFDAGLNQLSYPLTALLSGQGWDMMVFHFYDQYGKGCHWSAVLIYYGFFAYLSTHLRRYGIEQSINVAFTTCFTAFTIAIFEYVWMGSYVLLQDQSWILSFTPPQTMITIQNLVFFLLGVLRLGNINWKILKLNFDKWTWIFLSGSLLTMIVWWTYGLWFPVQQIMVQTDMGPWTSSIYFPQTVYTIALSPLSSIHVNSIALWIHNDWIHLVNVLAKVFITLTCLNIFLIRYRKQKQ